MFKAVLRLLSKLLGSASDRPGPINRREAVDGLETRRDPAVRIIDERRYLAEVTGELAFVMGAATVGEVVVRFFDDVLGEDITRFPRGVRTTTIQVVIRMPAAGIDPRPGGLGALELGDVVLVVPGDAHKALTAYSRLRGAAYTNKELADQHRRVAAAPVAGSSSFRVPTSSPEFARRAI